MTWRCLILAGWLGLAAPAAALASPDCLRDHAIGVFVTHQFTDAGGGIREGVNFAPVYSQISGRLRAVAGAVVEIGASSGREAIERTGARAPLLAFLELFADARDVALPGGQRTSWQDVRLQASLRLIEAGDRRLLGQASDMMSVAGLSIADALATALPGLIERLSEAALTQACGRPELLPAATIVRVAEEPGAGAQPQLLEQQLKTIALFADQFCKEIPLEGEQRQSRLSGQARAELSNILRRLVDLGIDGAGEINLDEYAGFERSDLLPAFQTNQECRLNILNYLTQSTP
jgi:hypothetical protein